MSAQAEKQTEDVSEAAARLVDRLADAGLEFCLTNGGIVVRASDEDRGFIAAHQREVQEAIRTLQFRLGKDFGF